MCGNSTSFDDTSCEDSNMLLCIYAVIDLFSKHPYLMVDKTSIDGKYRPYFTRMQFQLFPDGKLPSFHSS